MRELICVLAFAIFRKYKRVPMWEGIKFQTDTLPQIQSVSLLGFAITGLTATFPLIPTLMSKTTLRFSTLPALSSFSRQLTTGYLLNTSNLTLTAIITGEQILLAEADYGARQIEFTDRVFSYDPQGLA